MKYFKYGWPVCLIVAAIIVPELGFASVESTLTSIQMKLTSVILPLASILGLGFAGLSFVMGNPNAKEHLKLAIMGAVVGFGATSIIAFIRSVVQ